MTVEAAEVSSEPQVEADVNVSAPKTLAELRAEGVKRHAEKMSQTSETADEPEVKPDETEEVEEVESKDKTETPETEEEESTEEESNDVLSQIDWSEIDWSELDDEAKSYIGKEIGSGSQKRIGELTGRIKELEAELQSKESVIDESLGKVLGADNLVSSFTDAGKLDEYEASVDEQLEKYTAWIGDPDNEIYEHDGNTYSRSDVLNTIRELLRYAKDIPKQRQHLKKLGSLSEKSSEYSGKARAEFDWMDDTDSGTRKEYDKLVGDPDMGILKRVSPELAAKLGYLFAHAANSMTGASKPTKRPELKIKKKASSPNRGATTSPSQGDPAQRQLANLQKHIDQAKTPNEKIAAIRAKRQLQISLRT